MNEQKFNVEHISISTATVNIRHMVINNRKLTLSIFRQIPEGMLINEEFGSMNGAPWGWVNYRWDGCGRKPQPINYPSNVIDGCFTTSLHVVFQKDDELRRCVIRRLSPSPMDHGYFPSFPEEAATYIRKWNLVYDSLSRLPQIFIAV